MPGARLWNPNKQVALAENLRVADSFFRRLKGLLGTSCLPAGLGLVIRPCNSVHMLGMRYPIDVLFVNAAGEVLRVCHSLQPWRAAYCRSADWVVELPAGTAAATNTAPGDRIEIASS